MHIHPRERNGVELAEHCAVSCVAEGIRQNCVAYVLLVLPHEPSHRGQYGLSVMIPITNLSRPERSLFFQYKTLVKFL